MTPEDRRQLQREKLRNRIRCMKAMCARAIESCDADAVVLIMSFSDCEETSVRMSTFGNGVLCKSMVDAAKDRMERDVEIDD